jgi:hypothetical protein
MSAPTGPDPAIIVAGGVPAQRAVTVFPAEIHLAPRSRGERTSGDLIHWNEVDRGGHFAAREQPDLLAAGLREAFRPLR